MGLSACNLKEELGCSNGFHKGTISHQIRISRSGDRQNICRIVEIKIRGNILCSKWTSRLALSMERIPSKPGQDWWNETLTRGMNLKNLSLLLLVVFTLRHRRHAGGWYTNDRSLAGFVCPPAFVHFTMKTTYYLLKGDLTSDVNVSLLQPIKTSRYSLCSEV